MGHYDNCRDIGLAHSVQDEFMGGKPLTTEADIDYRYSEGRILEELKRYIDATYGEHYSQNKFQSTEFIIDAGHGVGFTIGNIIKYAQRYGRKGKPSDWRKDLLKVIHYAIFALHVHDQEHEPS